MLVENTQMADHIGDSGPETGCRDDDVRPQFGAVRKDDPITVEMVDGRDDLDAAAAHLVDESVVEDGNRCGAQELTETVTRRRRQTVFGQVRHADLAQ